MADYFKEQIIKTSMDVKSRSIKLIIGIVISGAILFFVPLMGLNVIILAALFFFDYKFTKFFAPGFLERDLEFEYIATNGTFEVDKVINKSSRRKEIECEMKDISWFGKLDNPKLLGQAHGSTILDLSNIKNKNNNDKYVFIITHKDKKTQVIFEPNEDMVKIFQVFVPKHAIEL